MNMNYWYSSLPFNKASLSALKKWSYMNSHILFYESKMYIILSTEPYRNYEIKCNFKNDTDHWEKKYFHEKNKFLLLILVIVITLPPKATLFIGPDFRCTETVKYYSTKLSPSRETTIHIRPLFQCWKWGLIKGETTVSIIILLS
jgi:hypothetical protein